ncbi:MAG: DUF1697 domain-containing protein [Vicinamibacterales bacterium]
MAKGRVVVLLRAVNVGGRILRMADLTEVLRTFGCIEPKTLLQTGNAVFGLAPAHGRVATATLEKKLEQALLEKTGVQSDMFVRTLAEWEAAIAANPFEEASTTPARMVLVTLRDAPNANAVKALADAIKGRERIHVDGRSLFVVYPDGQGTSTFTNVVIERTLGTRGTARNWNTVLKLQALLKQ